jgi:hypothetical protein
MVSLDKLRPGEKVVYYEGASLARTRAKNPEDPQLEAADLAWRLALEGRVILAQRRTDKGTMAYLAIGRREIDRQPVLPAKIEGPAVGPYRRAA